MNKQSCAGMLAAAVMLAAGASVPAQDVIFRSNGPEVRGTVSEITKTQISVKKGSTGGTETVPANEIVRIDWAGEPPKLKLVRPAETAGRLDSALADYTELLKEVSTNAKVKSDLEYLIARVMVKMALADPTKLDDAIKRLEAFKAANPTNFRYYEAVSYLGQAYLAKQDFAKAATAFTEMATAPWSEYKMAAQSATGRLKLAQDDVDGALAAFGVVVQAQAKTPAEASRRFEALLGQATCLARQKKFQEAVQSLDQILQQASADDSRVQAEAYVRQGDCLQALGKTKEAILAYLHVPILFSAEKALHAEALYHLAQLWPQVAEPERGAQARAELESTYPNSEWTKKLPGSTGS